MRALQSSLGSVWGAFRGRLLEEPSEERTGAHSGSSEARRGEGEVYELAETIIGQLNEPKNASKGSWRHVPLHVFRKGYESERAEVIRAVDFYYVASTPEDKLKALDHLIEETGDLGAYLMMLHSEARRMRRGIEDSIEEGE